MAALNSLDNATLIQYYKNLRGNFFKILPIYEGRDAHSKQIVHESKYAYEMFRLYLEGFEIELVGNSELYFSSDMIKMISILKGMKSIQEDQHRKIKSSVFECINICNKILQDLGGDS